MRTRRIAVVLTGLVGDQHRIAHLLKGSFDYLSEDFGLDFDFYCHFWSNDNRYPMDFDHKIIGHIKFPEENIAHIDHVKEVFSPVASTTSDYMELYEHFLAVGNDYDSPLHCEKIRELDTMFRDKKIHKNFFIDVVPESAHGLYEDWLAYLTGWIHFVTQTSQVLSAAKGTKLVVDSGIQYDAVIRWRFDNLLPLQNEHITCRLFDLFRDIEPMQLSVPFGILDPEDGGGKRLEPFTQKFINMATHRNAGLHDSYWMTDLSTAKVIADGLIPAYFQAMVDRHTVDYTDVWVHSFWYVAFSKLGMTPIFLDLENFAVRRGEVIGLPLRDEIIRFKNNFVPTWYRNDFIAANLNSGNLKYDLARHFNFDHITLGLKKITGK